MFYRYLIPLALLIALVIILASAPAAIAAGPQGPSIAYHTVQYGEYVSMIAQRYGVTAREVIEANHLFWPYWIHPGQVLVIPNQASSPEQVVRGFYAWYRKVSENGQDPFTARTYRTSPLLTVGLSAMLDGIPAEARIGGLDPVVCAPQVPSRIKVDWAIVTASQAQVAVRDSSNRTFTVGLTQEGNMWRMSSISCKAQ